ncbi:MAG: hypothetical protein U5N86_05325 [Planctomycetota bacterium]|nr:hypothetical protein [Planctomycetota bacterium]
MLKVFAPVYAKSFFLKRWLCFWFSSRPFELARHEEFLLEPSNNGNCKPETDDKDGEVQGEVSEAMDNDDPAESLSGPAIESEDESEEQGEQAGGDDGDGQYDKAAEPPEGMPSGGPDYIQPRKSVFSLAGSVALLFVFLFAIPLYIYSVSFVRLIQTDKSQSTVRMYESSYDDTFPRRLLYFMFSPFDEHKDKSASTTEFAKWVVKGPRKADDMSDYKPPDLDNEIYISADQTKMLVFPTGVFALAVERSRDMYDYHSGVGKEENYKPHPFESRWFHWPLLLKVIWYDTWSSNYHKYEQRMVRGVVAIGNPILFWFGLPCILFLIWGAIEERRDRSSVRLSGILLYVSAVGDISEAGDVPLSLPARSAFPVHGNRIYHERFLEGAVDEDTDNYLRHRRDTGIPVLLSMAQRPASYRERIQEPSLGRLGCRILRNPSRPFLVVPALTLAILSGHS